MLSGSFILNRPYRLNGAFIAESSVFIPRVKKSSTHVQYRTRKTPNGGWYIGVAHAVVFSWFLPPPRVSLPRVYGNAWC